MRRYPVFTAVSVACALVGLGAWPNLARAQSADPGPTEPAEPTSTAPPSPPVSAVETPAPRPPPSTPYLAPPAIGDWITIGAGSAIALGSAIVSPQPRHWRGGIGFDEDARNLLRLNTLAGRYRIRDASDVGLSLAVTWPFLVDALIGAWYTHGDPELARRMAVVDAEAIAIVGAVQETTALLRRVSARVSCAARELRAPRHRSHRFRDGALLDARNGAHRIDPLGPGNVLILGRISAVEAVPEGKFVFEETLHIITAPPIVRRARGGYAFRLGPQGQHSVGFVVDVLDVPKRDDSLTLRAGPVLRFVLSRHFEVRGSFVMTVVSPDRIGLIGGDFTELGIRWRTATE